MAKSSLPPFHRFAEKIQINPATGCWEWVASKDGYGYASFKVNRKHISGHRFAYLTLVGPIPDGYQIDHFLFSVGRCVKHCVNPDHLRAVPVVININNRTTSYAVTGKCKRGHLMTESNIAIHSGDKLPRCKTCARINKQEKLAENKEAVRQREKAYRDANAEHRRQTSREHYAANKQAINARHRAHWAINKDEINAKRKASRSANPEKRRIQERQYRLNAKAKKQALNENK